MIVLKLFLGNEGIMNTNYYAKSLEDDLKTKTVKDNKKVNCQSIENIISTKTIKPNTISFGKKKRLACTLLSKEYLKTYRAQGIIFNTKMKPNYVAPCDLILLTDAQKIIVQYYRIKNNLHIYYNHNLIKGSEKFIFKNSNEMKKIFKSPKQTWLKINQFRLKNKLTELPKSKFKLVEYNEIIFQKTIKIMPVAIFGYSKKTKEIAKRFNLPHYKSAKSFYKKIAKNEK